jgi:O-antigen/teichoic acid export membrane protein
MAVRQLGTPDFRGSFRGEAREGLLFALSLGSQNTYNDIDKTLVATLSGSYAAGIYTAAYRAIDVAFAPVRSLVYAAYPAFFQHGQNGLRASAAYGRRLLVPSLLYGVVGSVLLWLAAPLAGLVLGGGYAEAAVALRWLIPLLLVKIVHYLGQDALTGGGRQGVRTALQLAVVACNVLLDLILIPRYGWRGAAWATLAGEGLLAVAVWSAASWLGGRGGIRDEGVLR